MKPKPQILVFVEDGNVDVQSDIETVVINYDVLQTASPAELDSALDLALTIRDNTQAKKALLRIGALASATAA